MGVFSFSLFRAEKLCFEIFMALNHARVYIFAVQSATKIYEVRFLEF